ISADGRRVPDFERGQECLTAFPEKNSGGPALRPWEGVQVADSACGADLQALVRRNKGLPTQRRQVDQPSQVRLLRGIEPGSACEPGVTIAPVHAWPLGRSPDYFGDGVEVHESRPTGNGMREDNCPLAANIQAERAG